MSHQIPSDYRRQSAGLQGDIHQQQTPLPPHPPPPLPSSIARGNSSPAGPRAFPHLSTNEESYYRSTHSSPVHSRNPSIVSGLAHKARNHSIAGLAEAEPASPATSRSSHHKSYSSHLVSSGAALYAGESPSASSSSSSLFSNPFRPDTMASRGDGAGPGPSAMRSEVPMVRTQLSSPPDVEDRELNAVAAGDGRRRKSSSSRGQSSQSNTTPPPVPRRNSSVSYRSNGGERSAERVADLPPSPSVPATYQTLTSSDALPPPPIQAPQGSSGGSSDTSDYGSDAEEHDNTFDGPSSGSRGDGIGLIGDSSHAFQLTGGPPQLQRPARTKLGSPNSTRGASTMSPTSSSSGSTAADGQPKRSRSPRKPHREPTLQAQSAMSELRQSRDRESLLGAAGTLRELASTSPPIGSQTEDGRALAAEKVSGTKASPIDEATLEAEAIRAADLADPDRPRTLKEARELAKARARAKREGSREITSPERAQVTTSLDAVQSNPQPVRSNDSDYTDIGNGTMDDLQAAVGNAMADLSFSSQTTASDHNLSTGTAMPPPSSGKSSLLLRPTSEFDEGRATSRASTDQSFNSAHEQPEASTSHQDEAQPQPQAGRMTHDRGQSSSGSGDTMLPSDSGGHTEGEVNRLGMPTPRDVSSSWDNQQYVKGGIRPAQSENKSAMSLAQALSLYKAGDSSGGATPTAEAAPAAAVAPTLTTAQLREQAKASLALSSPSGPGQSLGSYYQMMTSSPVVTSETRLGIPGKTIPFPPAMNFGSVSYDKRKMPPWERARAYAELVNELACASTGLELWMQASQKPRAGPVRVSPRADGPNNGPRFPTSSSNDSSFGGGGTPGLIHPRDASGASARSDMTFPMRGDGARARDVTAILVDPSKPETMPGAVPSGIPYPTLVSAHPGAQRSLSSTSGLSNGTTNSSTSGATTLPMGATGLRVRQMSNNALDTLAGFSSGRISPSKGSVASMGSGSTSTVSSNTGPPPSSSNRPGLFGLGRRGSKRSAHPGPPTMMGMTSSTSLQSVSGPRPPRLQGAAGVLGRAIGSGSNRSASAAAGPPNISSPISSPITTDYGKPSTFEPSKSMGAGLGSTRGSIGGGDGGADTASAAMFRRGSNSSGMSGSASSPYGPRGLSSTRQPSPNRAVPTSLRSTASNNAIYASGGTGRYEATPGGRGGNDPDADPRFKQALTKVMDVLPDAEPDVLRGYLERASGQELNAIGQYLEDQSLGKIRR